MPRSKKPGGKFTPPARNPQDVATDRLFLGDDLDWPNYPVLPIKHKRERDAKGFPKLGYLLALDKQKIYLGNIFDPPTKVPTIEYTDREAMILDGWVVD